MEPIRPLTAAIPLLSGAKPVAVVGPAHLIERMGVTAGTPCTGNGQGRFRVLLVSADGMSVEYGPVVIRSEGAIQETGAPDLIYVPAPDVDFEEALRRNRPYLDWMRECHARGTIVTSSCTGALFLAEAGLLDGRQATTHWCQADFFASRYPKVHWQISRMVVEDGRVITAGGATAYLNLMIKLAEKFFGRAQALSVARFILVDSERDSQLPYMVRWNRQGHGDSMVQKAQELLSQDLAKPIVLPKLAVACGVSPRTLLRRFRTAVGESPGKYLQGVRIEKAKDLLERTDRTVEEIVAEVGYDDSRSFRRLFRRHVGISPKRYRRKYSLFPAEPKLEEPFGDHVGHHGTPGHGIAVEQNIPV
ncbi:GlxA family transcriptional regulator [Verrucomicrobium sp. 3C]|uniref:GlxA family transcriptional regulator n=1 Tax=Verrucomicrobium sp. 3C TaxID=1134055 RepID=UPI00037CE636|nr:helix-turn-helix domain-containing protein [Verrucomicrobium sp. 3C]